VSVTFVQEAENLFVVTIEGVLKYEDLKAIESQARDHIDRSGRVRVLVLAGQFSGWGKEGDWGDLTFMYEFDPLIERIAVLANETWKDEFLMFLGAGNRQAEVLFFAADQENVARDWLGSVQE
jgi:hypothetical protein